MDVLELDAASNNGVDSVRALREEAVYSPASVSKRVYIVDEVHMLSNPAFNALLKILEEPPEHLVFILATTELHKVPSTILSRCQRYSFKRLAADSIAARLRFVAENEGLTLSDEAVEKLAALADGSMRDGLSLLDQCVSDTNIDLQRVLDTIGLAGQKELLRLAEAISDRDFVCALGILDGLYSDGRDMASLLGELALLMRDLLVFGLSADSPLLSGSFSGSELSGLSKKLVSERLLYSLEIIREASSSLSRGGGTRLTVEMCLLRLCDERLVSDSSAILSRLERLEAGAGAAAVVVPSPTVGLNSTDDEIPALSGKAIAEERDEPGVPDSGGAELSGAAANDVSLDSPSPEKGSDGFWSDILEQLKGDAAIYFPLSDSSEISAELQDNTLIIRAGNPFSVNQVESKQFSDAIKGAALKVLGREVVIRAVLSSEGSHESKHDKLEKLVDKFSIVNFE